MLTATVSGSFHRHMHEIERAVNELIDSGVRVLSPADPRIVDSLAGFLFVASDRVRSIRLVQDRHLESIRCSDFLWLITPDGYVGQSASMELGFAVGKGIPIYSSGMPSDLTLRQYVRRVLSIRSALEQIESLEAPRRATNEGFLINPLDSVEVAQKTLEEIRHYLKNSPRQAGEDIATKLYGDRNKVCSLLSTD